MLGGDTATAAAVDVMPAGVGAVTDAAGAMSAMLAAVADRAMPGEPVEAVDAVGVAFAVTPDDGPRVLAEHAALAAFPTPLLVPRPVAVAAWFLHHNLRPNDVTLAVFEVDAGAVSVALVRRGRDGAVELAGFPAALPPAGDDVDLAAHLDGAVGLLDAALARAGATPAAIDTIVLAGEPAWLGQLAVQAGVATGVGTVIDPQPELAAALGAALLAGGPERRLDAAGLALLGPFLLAGHVPPVGDVAAGTVGAGAAVGAALSGEAAGDGVGSVAGQALFDNGATALRDKTVPGQGLKSGGSSGGGFPGALGGLLGNKGLVAGALAALAALVVVGAVAAGGTGGGDDDSVEAAGPGVTEPDDDVATTEDDADDDASTTTVASSTTTTPDSSTTLPGADDPGTPADPGTPVDPGAAPGGLTAPGDPPSSPGTTASTTTTTTAPRDTTPPVIGALVASPTDIDENGFEFCTRPDHGGSHGPGHRRRRASGA